MLKRRTRSYQKDQKMNLSEAYLLSDILSQKHKNNSFLKVPGLFVGFSPMIYESDSVRSPTSPLDSRFFSSLGSPIRCPRSQNEGQQKSWDCSKVGLSIIDSLDNENKVSGKITQFSDNKSILIGRQMRASGSNFGSQAISLELPKSLPVNFAVFPGTLGKPAGAQKSFSDVVFEIGETPMKAKSCEDFHACSLDSVRFGPQLGNKAYHELRFGSGNLVLQKTQKSMPSESKSLGGSLLPNNFSEGQQSSSPPPSVHSGPSLLCLIPASEFEQSEDYTCVRTHGPNPKVTHIFGDCIFECHGDGLDNVFKQCEVNNAHLSFKADGPSPVFASYPSEDFLKFCHSCNKKLDGEDIYMYRGEQAFCSYSCRSEAIEIDETESLENPNHHPLPMNL